MFTLSSIAKDGATVRREYPGVAIVQDSAIVAALSKGTGTDQTCYAAVLSFVTSHGQEILHMAKTEDYAEMRAPHGKAVKACITAFLKASGVTDVATFPKAANEAMSRVGSYLNEGGKVADLCVDNTVMPEKVLRAAIGSLKGETTLEQEQASARKLFRRAIVRMIEAGLQDEIPGLIDISEGANSEE